MAEVTLRELNIHEVRVALTEGRTLVASLRTRGGSVVIQLWGREKDAKRFERWPGDELGPDFLNSYEQTVLVGGLEELSRELLGKISSPTLTVTVLEVLDTLLETVAIGRVVPGASV